jgi:hypothetical protein
MRSDSLPVVGRGGQGVEVSVVGGSAYLVEAVQVGHSLSHWAPAAISLTTRRRTGPAPAGGASKADGKRGPSAPCWRPRRWGWLCGTGVGD